MLKNMSSLTIYGMDLKQLAEALDERVELIRDMEKIRKSIYKNKN